MTGRRRKRVYAPNRAWRERRGPTSHCGKSVTEGPRTPSNLRPRCRLSRAALRRQRAVNRAPAMQYAAGTRDDAPIRQRLPTRDECRAHHVIIADEGNPRRRAGGEYIHVRANACAWKPPLRPGRTRTARRRAVARSKFTAAQDQDRRHTHGNTRASSHPFNSSRNPSPAGCQQAEARSAHAPPSRPARSCRSANWYGAPLRM